MVGRGVVAVGCSSRVCSSSSRVQLVVVVGCAVEVVGCSSSSSRVLCSGSSSISRGGVFDYRDGACPTTSSARRSTRWRTGSRSCCYGKAKEILYRKNGKKEIETYWGKKSFRKKYDIYIPVRKK